MIEALAPRMRRGCSWVWLSVVIACGFVAGASALAQQPAGKTKEATPPKSPGTTLPKDAAKGKADEKAKAKEKEEAPEDNAQGKTTETAEVYKDPRAEKALEVFGSVPGIRDLARPNDINQVRAMAAGQAGVERDVIDKVVQSMAVRLLDRTNINALIAPDPKLRANSAVLRAISEATDNLIEPLNSARMVNNKAFLDAYIRSLLDTLPKLLDKNLVTRNAAMIVLGQAGSRDALQIYLNQLKDPNQTVQVKLWAVRGISTIVDDGKATAALSAAEAINAAKVIADFLEREKDTLWFLQMRALEAIGALRQAATPANVQRPEMAATAMKFLADPEARPEVRAAAAWALGMMQVSQNARFNFPLVAHEAGRLSAEIGEQANASLKENPTRSAYLAGLLVGPIYQAFNGISGARESGLLHAPALGQAQGYASKVNDLISSVARAAVVMLPDRTPTAQQKNRQRDLSDRVAALKSWLDKNPPKDYHLVPGGPEFKGGQAEVAEAPAGNSKLAGARGGH
jgi:hypothetical protein